MDDHLLPGEPVDPVPDAPGPDATYQELLRGGVLGFQACSTCRGAVFPPRTRCSRCGADSLRWRSSAGAATVYSTTVISPRGTDPYAVVLVDLDEGYRMMSRIEDVEVAIGDRVRVDLVDTGETVLPMFVRAEVDR